MATILSDTLRIPFCIFDLIKIVAIFLGEIIMKAIDHIQSLIISLPGRPDGMLAQDLAKIYHVNTGNLNKAVKRNKNRFE
jgi:flagellin-specific chaperone FliS